MGHDSYLKITENSAKEKVRRKLIAKSLRELNDSCGDWSKRIDSIGGTQEAPGTFSACSPPDSSNVQFFLNYRRLRTIYDLLRAGHYPEPDGGGAVPRCPDFYIGCVKISRPNSKPNDRFDPSIPNVEFRYGIDLKFDQIWNLTKLTLGDLSSTISLAPSEQLTLEFLSSQRTLFEKKTLDSVEEMNSSENTTADKEVVNVARSSSRTENWNVSANGSVSLGSIASFGASGGASATTTTNSQTSLQQVREATRKSAQSLKTQHKIEVRGLTETSIQNRMIRVIKNHYRDRALTLNVFQLLKHFSVETKLSEIRPVIAIKINGLEWDDKFITSHVDFLENFLLDPTLIDELPQAVNGAKFVPGPEVYRELIDLAKNTLYYLFEKPNIFKMLRFIGGEYTQPNGTTVRLENLPDADPNLVSTSFDPGLFTFFPEGAIHDHFGTGGGPSTGFTYAERLGTSAFFVASKTGLARFYTILQFLYTLYIEHRDSNRLTDIFLLDMLRTLRDEIDTHWENATADLKDLIIRDVAADGAGRDAYIEIFRRLSGFRSMVRGFLQYRLGILDEYATVVNQRQKDRLVTTRLIEHMNCNMNYYVQQFLTYIAQKTNNQTIIDFAKQVFNSMDRTPQDVFIKRYLEPVFDFERVFIDRQQLIIPAFWYLPPNGNREISIPNVDRESEIVDMKMIKPVVDNDIIVPLSDGVHIEVSPGACILNEVPEPVIEQPAIILKCDCQSCKDSMSQQQATPRDISPQNISA